MKTLNVSLTESLEEYIQRKVRGGTYASASEVIREALRDMEQRETRTNELRLAIREGIVSGKGRSLEEITVHEIARSSRKHAKK